ncbi:MAG: hypothetical protein ABF672_06365 [Gluconobacter oxydans]|uniref:hypothetical protein n=1 Tax=Gluconobacter oxydans TaxID=442 RepID=UPI0039ED70AB
MMIRRLLAVLSLVALAACAGGVPSPAARVSDFGADVHPVLRHTAHAPVKAARYGVTATGSTDPNATLNWCSYTGTGNVACIQTATAVASAVNARVLAAGGASTSQTLTTPTLSSPAVTGGTQSGTAMTGVSVDSTSTINSASRAANSIVRTNAERFGDRISALDYCALSDVNGSTDNTACIQRAIYAVCAASGGQAPWGSGGEVFFPPAVWTFSSLSAPCNGVTLSGANNGNVNSGSLDYRGTVFRLITPANQSAISSGMTTSDYGGGLHVRDVAIDGSSMAATATVFDYSWVQHSTIKNVSAYNITNFFREEGGAANTIEDVVILGISGTGIEFFGDASACSDLASCNKRADLLRVNRVNMNGTVTSSGAHTATCFAYHDFAQSLNVDHAICENALFGLNIYCQASQGHNGEACPAFPRFHDLEAENCTTCGNISDAQDVEMRGGYMLGQGTASAHVLQVYNTNFGGAASSSAVGSYAQAFRNFGGRFGNSGGAAVVLGVADFVFSGSQIFSSNLSDTNNSIGAPNIEVTPTGSTTNPTRGIITQNILCEASGQQPLQNTNDSSLSLIQSSIWLDVGVTNTKVFGNEYSRCVSGPKDFTTSNSTNTIAAY